MLSGMEPFMNHPPNPKKQTLDVNWHYGTLRGVFGFIAGMSIWQLYTKDKLKKILANGWSLLVLMLICFYSMYTKFYDTFTVVVFAFIILSSAYGSKNIDKFYSFKLFEKLGQWSFSIYMWHMVLIHVVMLYFIKDTTEPIKGLLRPFKGDYPVKLMLVAFLVLTSIVAYFSFKYIETPTRNWIKKTFNS